MTSASTREYPPNSSRSHPPSTTLTRANSAARTNAVLKLKRAASQRTANAVAGSSPQPEEEERGRSQVSPASLLRAGSAAGNYARPGVAAAAAAAAGGLVASASGRLSAGDNISPSTSVESLSSSPVYMRGRLGSQGNDYSPESSMHPFPGGVANLSTDSLARPGSSASHNNNIERSARSPLPSLEQLRARILHERATSGLARSASTGAANAASAVARAYAMDKLLGGSGHGHDLSDGTAASSADGYHFLDTKAPNAAGLPKGRAPSPTMSAAGSDWSESASAIRDRAGLRRSRTIGSLTALAEAQRKAAFLRDASDAQKSIEESAAEGGSQLQRQPSQREIARTQMMRKLSARRGAGRGVGNTSDGSSPGPSGTDLSVSQTTSAIHSPEASFATNGQDTASTSDIDSNSSPLPPFSGPQITNASPRPVMSAALHPQSASLAPTSPSPSAFSNLAPPSPAGQSTRGPTAMSVRSEDEGHFQYERMMGTGSSLSHSPMISNAQLESVLGVVGSSSRRPSTPEVTSPEDQKSEIPSPSRKARAVWSGANDFARHSFGISSPREDAEAAADVPVSPPRDSMISNSTSDPRARPDKLNSSSSLASETTTVTALERTYAETVPLTIAQSASLRPGSWRDTRNWAGQGNGPHTSFPSEISSDGRMSGALAARSSLTPTRPTIDLPSSQFLTAEALSEQNALLRADQKNGMRSRSRSRSPASWAKVRRKSTFDSQTDDGSRGDEGDEFDVDAYLYSDDDDDDVIAGSIAANGEGGGTQGVTEKTANGSSRPQHLAVPGSARVNSAHSPSLSALKDLGGERPSQRLQALLGESFVREYGAPSDFDQSSPLRENRLPDWEQQDNPPVPAKDRVVPSQGSDLLQTQKPELVDPQQAWETNGYQKVHDKWLQAEHDADVASHRWSEQTSVAPSVYRGGRETMQSPFGIVEEDPMPDVKPPVPSTKVPPRLLSSLDSPQQAMQRPTFSPATPKGPAQESADASSPRAVQADIGESKESDTPVQSRFGMQRGPRELDTSLHMRSSSASAAGSERTSTSYLPPASNTELGTYYANDKLRPFPGLSSISQASQGRPRAAQTPPAPLVLDNSASFKAGAVTAAPISPPPGSKGSGVQSPTFFSSLRRKVTGSRPKDKGDSKDEEKEKGKGHSRTGSSSGNRLFSPASLRRAASFTTPKGRAKQVTSPTSQPPPAEVQIISRQGSAAYSDQSRGNSVLSQDASRDITFSPERPGSEALQNGEAEAEDATPIDVSALTPATAAKLRRYSHILTTPAVPSSEDAALAAAAYPHEQAKVLAERALAAEESTSPGISNVAAMDPPRKYLLGGAVYQVVSETLVKDRFLFLFDDLLVVAKAVRPDPLRPADASGLQSPQGRPLPDLKWEFSVKSIIELRQVQLSTPKEHVVTPRSHPLMPTFVRQFLTDPTEALEHIIANSSLPRDASTVAQLLFHTPELDRDHLTVYLCAPERRNVLQAYVSLYKLGGVSIESALRTFLIEVRFPSTTDEFDALLLTFAQYWAEANEGLVKAAFTAQMSADLVFAMMALNDALHSGTDAATPNLFSAPAPDITKEAFVESFRARDPEMVIPDRTLLRIFASIAAEPFAQSLARDEQYLRIPVRVQGVLPSKLTFAVPCQQIVVSIPEPDPDFSIRLYGQDLVFEPAILDFAKSTTQSFTMSSKSLGQRHAVFVRAGKNASRYVSYTFGMAEGADRGSKSEPPKETALPRSLTLNIERAFVRNSFSVTLAAAASAQSTRWRYTFSVVDDKARADWVQRIKSAIHASSRRRRHQDAKQRAADSIAINVLRQALIEPEGTTSPPSTGAALQRSVSAAASPAPRLPPGKTMALDRNVSTSKHYYGAQGVGRLERDLLPSPSLLGAPGSPGDTGGSTSPLRRAASAAIQTRDAPSAASKPGRLRTMEEDEVVNATTELPQPGGESVSKDTTGDALIVTCQQNSLLPLVLESMRNETEV